MADRFPRAARAATVKCISCNAPSTRIASGEYVCVECGKSVLGAASIDDLGNTEGGKTNG